MSTTGSPALRASRPIRVALALAAALLVAWVPAGQAAPARPMSAGGPVTAAFSGSRVDLGLQRVVSGLSDPVAIAGARDGRNRLFVVEQAGRIRIIENGVLLPTPFLDIRSKVSCCGERGLLGLAFHPDFATNRKFYVYYTANNGDITVSKFAASAANPNVASTSELVLLRIRHRTYSNHNGGALAFGPDGYLYIGTGDGGGAGDSLRSGQNRASLLGKILRIDVNHKTSTKNYAIPSTNPYARSSVYKRQIWAYGLRNPWRISFDRTLGDLWIGDVGQGRYEEVDRGRRASGGARGVNFGWRVMEGRHCYAPASGCNKSGKRLPVAEYTHASGNCSVTGGYVYRGSAYPDMVGGYFFGDYCSGRIWSLVASGSTTQNEVLERNSGLSISSFGQGDDGELYLASYATGEIYHLVDNS